MPLSGDSLLQALRANDPAVIRDVVAQHARRLYRTARGFGVSDSDAEDLVQDVFVTFLSTLERFEGRSSLSTWLTGILQHKAHEYWRARGREQLTGESDDVFEQRFGATLAGFPAHSVQQEDRSVRGVTAVSGLQASSIHPVHHLVQGGSPGTRRGT